MELAFALVGERLTIDVPSFVSVTSYLSDVVVSSFYPFGLNKFIYPGLTLVGDFLELGLTTFTVEFTYNSLATALLISGSRPLSARTADLLLGEPTLTGDAIDLFGERSLFGDFIT